MNFVKNTKYKLLAGSGNKIFAEGTCIDPAPKVPDWCLNKGGPRAGDYLLFKGDDINLYKGKGKVLATFTPVEELILKADWEQFDEEMTGQDLVSLGNETFLLWFQNIQSPPVPKPKKPTVTSKGRAKAKR